MRCTDLGQAVEDLEDLGALDDLVAQFVARQGDHADVDRVAHERRVVHQLVAGERRDRVQEEVGRRLEIAHHHAAPTETSFRQHNEQQYR